LLDNKSLSVFVKEALLDTSYEMTIKMYDKNCAQCPFNKLKIVSDKGRRLHTGHNLQDAIRISLDYESSDILRLCGYGGEEHTAQEIIRNTCRLWNQTEHDEGIFIEVESEDDLKLDAWFAKVADLDVELMYVELGIK
jgi:hypothetical protein